MLTAWVDFWYSWVSASFLRGYLTTTGQALFLPQKRADLRLLIDAYLLEKALYEVSYELNNRPHWVGIRYGESLISSRRKLSVFGTVNPFPSLSWRKILGRLEDESYGTKRRLGPSLILRKGNKE